MKFSSNKVKSIATAIGIVFLVALSFAFVAIQTIASSHQNTVTVTKAVDGPSFDALARLQSGRGSIKAQQEDIETLSKALNANLVTSNELRQKGDWLTFLRRRVDVREAVLAEGRLKVLEAKAAEPTVELSIKELEEAESLFSKVSRQIDSQYAMEEGLLQTHATLWRMMYHIRHGGNSPP